ncbi:hypothetical protein [Alkalihalobacterium alkalinitrilicum]|uniref:hypothetical protein n=1 Tax=Alkalihalobacterium alkalinitrilicum TaxID=427920 RepID=UPI000994C5C4|nr:hypothetical protein [Alkalihalobacterium alkalinitrilicum]
MTTEFTIDNPIQAELIIHVVKGKVVDSKCTKVEIVEFTTTSLIFISSLKFPVSEDVIYKVSLKLLDGIEIYGMILTSIKKNQTDDYYYEMRFEVY